MSNPKFGSGQSRVIITGLASLLLMACCVQWATGQGAATAYVEVPYDPSFMMKDDKTGEIKLNDRLVKQATIFKTQVLIGTLPFDAANKDQFNKWYTGYQLKGFSQIAQLHKLPERRKEIVDDLKRAKTKEIHDDVLANANKYMRVYVTHPTNFHPAVRFNAMLVMGDLNAEEQGISAKAIPLPSALDFMLAEYKKSTQLDAVKLAAMIGIMRHAQLNWARPDANKIPAAQQQEITDSMVTLINAKDPPAGRSREGHVWMQRRAVEILATLGLVGTNDTVTQLVSGLVHDHGADLTLRCTAAEALGKNYVKPPAKSKLDPTQESLHLAALLVEACHKDLERIETLQKKKMLGTMDPSSYGGSGMMSGGMPTPGTGMMGGSSGMSGMSGMGMGMGMEAGMSGGGLGSGGDGTGAQPSGPKDPLVELYRRQIKYEIECVRKGITGVGRLVNTEKNKLPFPELTKDIDAVSKGADPPASTLPSLHKSLKDSLKSLENKTAALLPKKKVVAEAPESDEPSGVPAAAAATTAPGTVAPGTVAPGTVAPGVAAPAAAATGAVAPGTGKPAVAAPAVAAPAAAATKGAAASPPGAAALPK